VLSGAVVMTVLRASVGFVLFLIAFELKEEDASTVWFGVALSLAALGTVFGNASAPAIRRRVSEETMLTAALVLAAAAAVVAAVVGGIAALVALAFAANLSGAIGRLGFESTLQRNAPQANRGRAIAGFETRFQLAWAAAALIPVMIPISDRIGALLVGIACGGGLAYTLLRPRLTRSASD
jgi:hypothetical protein